MSSMTWSRIIGLSALFCACNSAHVKTATETGNPPVIDVEKVSLEVTAERVRIVGEPGAVTPGGAEVEVLIVGTDMIARTTSKPDGSFAIPLDVSETPVVALRAKRGDQRSDEVYVTRGGASVGDLSCMQRSSFASQAIGSVLTKVDTSCRSVADCRLVPYRTVCTDTCSDALVAIGAQAEIEDAVESIDAGLCANFAADGCKVIAQPCAPPPQGPIDCVEGRCVQRDTSRECPPNARFVSDACLRCGDTGGCAETAPRCAIVCGEDSHCAGDPGGMTCSARGICEAARCD